MQLTWEANYRKAGAAIGVDLLKDPDAALDPANAVRIAFEGMEQGWFAGKELGDFLDGVDETDKEDLREFANARRIVNGTDKQIEIGKLALMFESALRAAGYAGAAAADMIVLQGGQFYQPDCLLKFSDLGAGCRSSGAGFPASGTDF